jgi:hypothetical protein
MNTHANPDSILQGKFCDIVNFFRDRAADDADRLAQRALTVILSTNHLVQTGYEVNTDPFSANMFASSALGSLNEKIRNYPFVRDSASCEEEERGIFSDISDEEYDAVLASAETLIEMAEGLNYRGPITPVVKPQFGGSVSRRLLVLTEGFRDGFSEAEVTEMLAK